MPPISPSMSKVDFYDYVKSFLRGLDAKAAATGVTRPIADYFVAGQVDLQNPNIATITPLNEIEQVYARFVFHAQNSRIGSVVKFNANFGIIRTALMGFSPTAVINRYGAITNYSDAVSSLTAEFASLGMAWRVVPGARRPGASATLFAKACLDGAVYLAAFRNKSDLMNDLLSHFPHGDYRKLLHYLKTKIQHGFGTALLCDWLKELDPAFDLPKPDTHLKDVLGTLLSKTYTGPAGDYDCIDDFLNIVNVIKTSAGGDPTLTAYKLDRMIWLCCTGNFFLTAPGGKLTHRIKKDFLAGNMTIFGSGSTFAWRFV